MAAGLIPWIALGLQALGTGVAAATARRQKDPLAEATDELVERYQEFAQRRYLRQHGASLSERDLQGYGRGRQAATSPITELRRRMSGG